MASPVLPNRLYRMALLCHCYNADATQPFAGGAIRFGVRSSRAGVSWQALEPRQAVGCLLIDDANDQDKLRRPLRQTRFCHECHEWPG
jgi:hypothetical protein